MAAVDSVACMSTKSSRMGNELRIMDKERLREEMDTGVVFENV